MTSSRSRICGTAAAASSRSTVMRTSSEPARASAATCATVESMSAVSVLVIDCTTIGAAPPTVTPPILTGIVRRRALVSMPQDKSDLAVTRQRGWRRLGARPGRFPPLQGPEGCGEEVGQSSGGQHTGGCGEGGRQVRRPVGGQPLQCLEEQGDGDQHRSDDKRPRPGQAENCRHQEIDEEVLCPPMQAGTDLHVSRDQRGNDDGGEHARAGERYPFRPCRGHAQLLRTLYCVQSRRGLPTNSWSAGTSPAMTILF